MVQILNTGAGLYKEWQPSSFDPIETIKEVGRVEADLAKYKYEIRQKREEEFLKSISVDTENMMYNKLQDAMKTKLEDFTTFAIGLEKKSNGNLTLEDKMKIAQKKRELEQWRDDRLNVAQQLVKKKQIVYQDMSQFDPDETQKRITDEENDILNVQEVMPPVMRYQGMYELYEDAYKQIGANSFYNDTVEEEFEQDGKKYIRTVQRRNGINSDLDRVNTFTEAVGDLNKGKYGYAKGIGRSIIKEWNTLAEVDKENQNNRNMTEYPTPNDLAMKKWFPAWANNRVLSKRQAYKEKEETGGGSGTGGAGKFSYMTQESLMNPIRKTNEKGIILSEQNTPNGIPVILTGKIKDAQGNTIKTTSNDIIMGTGLFSDMITGQMYSGSQEVDKTIDENQYKDKLNAGMEGTVWTDIDKNKRTTIKNADGTYSISVKLTPQDVYSDLTDETTKKDTYTQLKKRLKDPKFDIFASGFLGQQAKQAESNKPKKKKLY